MPWSETCPMEERTKFVLEALEGWTSMTELCARYGISRRIGYKWLRRYEERGLSALVEVVSSFVCKMGSWGAGSSGPFSRDVVIPSFLLGCAGPSAEGTKVSPAHAASPSFSSDSL